MNQGAGRGDSSFGGLGTGVTTTPPARSRELTRVAVILGLVAVVVGIGIASGSYAVSRRLVLHDVSEDSLRLAALLVQAVELRAPATRQDGLRELEGIWEKTERGYRQRYLWVVGAAGRLSVAVGGPELVGSDVGDIAIGGVETGGPTTLRQLLAAKHGWVGQARTPSGAGQVAAYVYSEALDALIGVHVPAVAVDAELHDVALPWLVGFGCAVGALLLAVKLLHRAYVASETATDEALAALRESEDRFRQFMAQAADPIVVFDAGGRILDANQRAEEAFGWSRDELLQMSIPRELIDADPVRNAAVRADLGAQGVATLERFLGRKDGSRFPAEIRVARVLIRGVHQYVGAARDVTERQRTEEEKAVLLDVARAVAGTLDLDAILARVQERTAQAFACDVVATFRLDPLRGVFRLVSHYGLPLELQHGAEALEFSADTVFAPRVANDRPVAMNDFSQAGTMLAELAAQFGITALLAAPLRVHCRQLGCLVAARRGGLPFAPRELDLCNGIAQELAVAIDVGDVYRQQQEEAQVSAALAAAGQGLLATLGTATVLDALCEITARQLQCEFSSLSLLQAQEDAYTPVATYGMPVEEWEGIRVVKMPRAEVSEMLARVERNGLVHLETLTYTPWPAFNRQFGVTSLLCVALRRNRDVIGLLVAGYRTRAHRFASHQERILRGIAHLASMTLENARLVEELQQANRLKSEFVATMSHELRTPLNIILGYSDLVLEGAFGELNKEQADTIERIERSGQQLLELINATLDVSRFEGRQTPPDLHEVDISELVQEIEADVREWLTNPNLDVTWQVEPRLPRMRTDPVKLKVLLKNLIGNAVKFTDRGSVSIAVATRTDAVEFRVSDTGVGIAPEVLPVIFEPFRQGDSSSTRRHGGVGLGLYIVRRIVDSLGGSIEVDSVVGKGTCFRVRLPRQAVADAAAA